MSRSINSYHPLYLVIFLLTASCSDTFIVQPTAGRTAFIQFFEPSIFTNAKIQPCLKWLRVYDQEDRESISWSVEVNGAPCKPIDSVIVGVAPTGFKSLGKPPKAGRLVRIAAQDGEGKYGSSEAFRISY